ncbi:hypothetical protein PIB30_021725 [Stylosanthes scabra]|uniref:Uncharacterized protein n=1 Tax=Stylosanthes scabra TaxID=79078 RepID=A0ABU6S9P0_9FABA|nr:hypothetical protein [Stylosanthes scabra]
MDESQLLNANKFLLDSIETSLLFSGVGSTVGSTPPRRSRGASSSKGARKIMKPRFKVTRDMDLNRVDTILFNYLFSDGHAR